MCPEIRPSFGIWPRRYKFVKDQKVPVAKEQEVPTGASRLLNVDGKEVALFNVEGRYYAVGNRCPHRSGPLVRGRVETVPVISPESGSGLPTGQATVAVRCPVHGWLFDLSTGACLTRPSASTPTYPVTCEDGQICLGPQQGIESGPSMPVAPGG